MRTARRYSVVDRQKRRLILPFLLPAAILYGAITLYPGISTVYVSFTEWSGIGDADWVGIDNYLRLFQDSKLHSVAVNTVVFVVMGGAILFPLAAFFALATKSVRFGKAYRFLILAPVALSVTTAALLWKFALNPSFGIVPGAFSALGLDALATWEWLGETSTAMLVVVLATIWHGVGIWMLFFVAAIERVPPELREAATLDGASSFQTFRYVVAPLIWEVTRTLLILWIIQASQTFGFIIAMTNGGPLGATEVVGTHLYKQAFINFEYGYAAAIAIALCLIVLVPTVIARRLSGRSDGVQF